MILVNFDMIDTLMHLNFCMLLRNLICATHSLILSKNDSKVHKGMKLFSFQ